jgi:tripartite-type tricarboxylate transporter receptor subunit TctC
MKSSGGQHGWHARPAQNIGEVRAPAAAARRAGRTTARAIAPKLSERLGQQIVVENRPGAAAMIGTEHVARAAPDGYTLLVPQSTITIVPSIYRNIRFDPLKDFEPITNLVVVPQVLVGHPSLPPRNTRELVAFAKANPGKLDYAAGAYGGNGHLSMVLFLTITGTNMTYVPYKSGNAGLSEAVGGQVPLMMRRWRSGQRWSSRRG